MLADVNLIKPVGGSQNMDKSRFKRRKPGHKRIEPKSQNPDAHNQNEPGSKKEGRLEVYA